jgi:accessory Sec system S-layer assembly protein
MNMLRFFKRREDQLVKQGQDSTIESNELLEEEQSTNGNESKAVKTKLSFHPDMQVSPEEKYYFQFLNNELAPLKENQLSIAGVELKKVNESVIVTAFVRNSLPKAIMLGVTPLLLIGPDGEKLGRKVFDLSVLGEIPAESSRPWQFVFEKEHLLATEFPQTDWKLAFELQPKKKPHTLDLEESWEQSLADTEKEKLEELVKNLTPPKPGEVNFMGIQSQFDSEGNLHVSLLIRNGSHKHLTIQQLPLMVYDAKGDVVAKGGFKLNDLVVKANTSKPWTFIFPKQLVLKEHPDLSSWKVAPVQQVEQK